MIYLVIEATRYTIFDRGKYDTFLEAQTALEIGLSKLLSLSKEEIDNGVNYEKTWYLEDGYGWYKDEYSFETNLRIYKVNRGSWALIRVEAGCSFLAIPDTIDFIGEYEDPRDAIKEIDSQIDQLLVGGIISEYDNPEYGQYKEIFEGETIYTDYYLGDIVWKIIKL